MVGEHRIYVTDAITRVAWRKALKNIIVLELGWMKLRRTRPFSHIFLSKLAPAARKAGP